MKERVSVQAVSVRRLTRRYIAGLTLVAALAIVTFLFLQEQIGEEQYTASVINVSGRQRMLSQKAALLSLRMVDSDDVKERSALRAELVGVTHQLLEGHNSLIYGNPEIGVSGRMSPEIMALLYEEPVRLEVKLNRYLAEIQGLLAVPESELTRDNIHVTNILALSGELLEVLDREVGQLQSESRVRISSFLGWQAFLLGALLAALLLQGMFIFQPAVNLLEKEAEELAAANMELGRLSNIDGLTAIANRRYLDEFLEKEWQRALRQGAVLTAIMVDIDFFKSYNDTYGHQMGDECLRKVAQVLSGGVNRSTDLVARYGGEEFAVIMPETVFRGGAVVAERLRSSVERLKLEHYKSPIGGVVTISLGVASIIPKPEEDASRLIALADQALYQAKQQGRNRVVAYDYTPKS